MELIFTIRAQLQDQNSNCTNSVTNSIFNRTRNGSPHIKQSFISVLASGTKILLELVEVAEKSLNREMEDPHFQSS